MTPPPSQRLLVENFVETSAVYRNVTISFIQYVKGVKPFRLFHIEQKRRPLQRGSKTQFAIHIERRQNHRKFSLSSSVNEPLEVCSNS